MYIVSLYGKVLAMFNKWDVKSVAQAEQWIVEHQYTIFKCELTVTGDYIITVRS